MPSLKAIRNRIVSVKNTQKITRAMKLMSAARLRKAQEAIVAARPYANAVMDVLSEIATRAGHDAHPLLTARPLKRVELVVVTSDRGLAGGFNSQIIRVSERYIYEHKPDHDTISLGLVGRKARDYFRRRKANIVKEFGGPTTPTALERAQEIGSHVTEDFLADKVDAVFLVYNEFKSAISQKPIVEQLLPVKAKVLPEGAAPTDYIYEPTKKAVLDRLVPMYVQIEIYRALLESIASELGARMSAMDSATKNASEMIGKLTLQYNRARQAAITKELLEIIGGAEALKG